VAGTKVIREGALLADYDAAGSVIGIEILAPVKLADLRSI
jgi:hypothetical protein